MTRPGLFDVEPLHQLLMSMLSAAVVAGAGLCLWAAGYWLTVAASRLRRRRRAQHADARLRAEVERGVEDLERYLAVAGTPPGDPPRAAKRPPGSLRRGADRARGKGSDPERGVGP